MSAEANKVVLAAEGLKKYYPVHAGLLSRHVADVKAVDGVSFEIRQGETLGLVGESGCGKSTLGRAVLRLEEPTAGKVLYCGEDITAWDRKKMKALRKEMQMVFQDPQSSLDPRMTVGDSIAEALLVHGVKSEKKRSERVEALLKQVGLEPDFAARYPHEFSGGQKQRIGIARALAVDPKLIVADEPVSALDVSVQAQIINLLMDLQQQLGLAFLFIAHDLSVIGHVSNRIAVMYLGRLVEVTGKQDLLDHPLHPYTRALLSAVSIPDPRAKRDRIVLQGDVPSPIHPPSGCHFHPRCPEVIPICPQQEPVLKAARDGHMVCCHLYD